MDIDGLEKHLNKVETRLHTIERLGWIAVGGVGAVGGLVLWVLDAVGKVLKIL